MSGGKTSARAVAPLVFSNVHPADDLSDTEEIVQQGFFLFFVGLFHVDQQFVPKHLERSFHRTELRIEDHKLRRLRHHRYPFRVSRGLLFDAVVAFHSKHQKPDREEDEGLETVKFERNLVLLESKRSRFFVVVFSPELREERGRFGEDSSTVASRLDDFELIESVAVDGELLFSVVATQIPSQAKDRLSH